MLATLALSAALTYAPAQAELTLSNARPTYGILGAARKDAEMPKLLPGDQICISFDIENLKVADDGKVAYSIGMEVADKDGKSLFKRDPENQEAINSLGGGRVPAFVASDIGTEVPTGEYTLTVTVKDRQANAEKKLSRKFQVIPAAFGMIRLSLSHDDQAKIPASPVAVPGQRLLVNFLLLNFERDKTTKQPNITLTMRVLENGTPTLKKDPAESIKTAPENFKLIPMTLVLNLNRPGKFTVEVKVTDDVAKKTVTETFDIQVVEAK